MPWLKGKQSVETGQTQLALVISLGFDVYRRGRENSIVSRTGEALRQRALREQQGLDTSVLAQQTEKNFRLGLYFVGLLVLAGATVLTILWLILALLARIFGLFT